MEKLIGGNVGDNGRIKVLNNGLHTR